MPPYLCKGCKEAGCGDALQYKQHIITNVKAKLLLLREYSSRGILFYAASTSSFPFSHCTQIGLLDERMKFMTVTIINFLLLILLL